MPPVNVHRITEIYNNLKIMSLRLLQSHDGQVRKVYNYINTNQHFSKTCPTKHWCQERYLRGEYFHQVELREQIKT